MWKIYNINLKENQPFIFYIKYKKLINICDEINPKSPDHQFIWTKNGWIPIQNYKFKNNTYVSNWFINKEDIEDCFKEQIREMTRLYFEDKYYEKYNLFLFTKIRQTGYSEIGIGLIDAKSNIKNVNEKMEDYLKRIVKLRIFS